MPFKALRVTETFPGKFERNIISMDMEELPPGELLVRVLYSSLNYKDALSAAGNKGITKKYPHTPGIDAAGVVELSRNEAFAVHDEVIITGHDLGMNTCGGYAEYIRIPAEWALQKPPEFSFAEAMSIGTAGFTAAFALHKMEMMGQKPTDGPVVVTGSTGGVGSMAVSILAKAGYEVIASTGKANAKEYLSYIGAARIEERSFVDDQSGKALLRPQWAGAIDTVGGNTLTTLLKGCRNEGNIVSTGLVSSPKLDATVYPFILNGVNLLGIGTAETTFANRQLLWRKLANEWNVKDKFPVIIKEVSLEELSNTYLDAILEGKIMGRILVKI
ncbi:MAG: YhdH/YhfP family quinone oxidoreductase [Chitinophagaceae bacterium]|nr:YhdH/YhfP family quinone oxidoreductase [Chitinophagaceae bacterium]